MLPCPAAASSGAISGAHCAIAQRHLAWVRAKDQRRAIDQGIRRPGALIIFYERAAFDSAIRRFESSRPSQPVRSSPVLAGGPPKSAQIGPIRCIRLSLHVPDRATGASFRFSVSEGHFWCLVFGRCGCSVKNSNERGRPPLSGQCRLKRLVAGVSGYIFDECVTKCVAVLKQHGGFAPTVPSRRSKAG